MMQKFLARTLIFAITGIGLPQNSIAAQTPTTAGAGGTAARDAASKMVNVEWESGPDVIQYDLEFTTLAGASLLFTTNESHWAGPMIPGVYKMRIRSKDSKGRVSDWSPADEFRVSLSDVHLLSPQPKTIIQTGESDQANVQFTWQKVIGADAYQLEVMTLSGKVIYSVTTKDTSYQGKLEAATAYRWRVQASANGLDSSSFAENQFEIWGPKVGNPKIQKPTTVYVRELSWSQPKYADHYSYMILHQNAQTHDWERIDGNLEFKDHRLTISSTLPGGRYRLSLKAKGVMHANSDRVDMDFTLREGDRSIAAEETSQMREAIDRTDGLYVLTSYFVAIMNYNGTNHDLNSSANFKGIGGTGRFGLGYLGKNATWGFLGIGDVSGISLTGNGNYLFASVETNAVYRTHIDDLNEIRQQMGVFYKELPEFTSANTVGGAGTLLTPSNVEFAGPHYGVEYWHSMDRHMGFELNAHLYPAVLGLKTPSGGAVSPSLSYQVGLLGSYRFDKDLTGLIGYAYREDQVNYKSSSSGGAPGTTNSDSINGHYLNVYLEWAL